MRRAFVLAAGLILAALLHFTVQLAWRLQELLPDDDSPGPEAACATQLLVFVPLDDESLVKAEESMGALLDAWRGAWPCDGSLLMRAGATTGPPPDKRTALTVGWLGSQDDDAEALKRRVVHQLSRVSHCFARIDVLGSAALAAHALPTAESRASLGPARPGQTTWSALGVWESAAWWRNISSVDDAQRGNALFLSALARAAGRQMRLLWVPPTSRPLRPRWVSSLACEAESAPDAWIIGSPLLMDCELEGGWLPAAACCAEGSAERSEWYLGPAAVYSSHSDTFLEYVHEWRTSTLSGSRFSAALSSLLWRGYHEARQRALKPRFVASVSIADVGTERVSLDQARQNFPRAALLQTTNISRPVALQRAGLPAGPERRWRAHMPAVAAKAARDVASADGGGEDGEARVEAGPLDRLGRERGASHQLVGLAMRSDRAGRDDGAAGAWAWWGEEAEGEEVTAEPYAPAGLEPSGTPEERLEQRAVARAGASLRIVLGFGTSDTRELTLNWAAACSRLNLGGAGGGGTGGREEAGVSSWGERGGAEDDVEPGGRSADDGAGDGHGGDGTGWLVVALDAPLHAFLVGSRWVGPHACALAPPSWSAPDAAAGADARRPGVPPAPMGQAERSLLLGALRVRTVALLLDRTGLEVLACDVDAIPLRVPWLVIQQHLAGDLIPTTGHPSITGTDGMQAAVAAQVSRRSLSSGSGSEEVGRVHGLHETSATRLPRLYDVLLLSEWPDARVRCDGSGPAQGRVGDGGSSGVTASDGAGELDSAFRAGVAHAGIDSVAADGSWPCASLGVVYAAQYSRSALVLFRALGERMESTANYGCGGSIGIAGQAGADDDAARAVAAEPAIAGVRPPTRPPRACPTVISILAEALGLPRPAADPLSATPASKAGPASPSRTMMVDVRWRLLEPTLFQNGHVAFRRPALAPQREHQNGSDAPAAAVMLRASWPWLRSGHRESEGLLRYVLREARLWRLPRSGARPGRWLGYGVSSAADSQLYRQRGALRSALMLARILRRTLVLPPFWTTEHGSRTAAFNSLYDYDAFNAAFADHCEASAVHELPGRHTFHIALADGPRPAAEAAGPELSGSFGAGSKGATAEQLRAWLKPWAGEPFLWFDRMYHRVSGLHDTSSQADFDASFRGALRPAPELAAVIRHVRRELRAGFNCLHVSAADIERNGERAFAHAAGLLAPQRATLLASSIALGGRARAWMARHFITPLYLADLLPPASRVLFEDAEGRIGLGLELVDTHVCASADVFVGNLLTPFSQAVCYERDGIRDVRLARGDLEVAPPCQDLYGRSVKGKAAASSL